jgi:hypothetical protein
MPNNNQVFAFGFGGIYDMEAARGIEMFLQTPWATTGVVIALSRQSIHQG